MFTSMKHLTTHTKNTSQIESLTILPCSSFSLPPPSQSHASNIVTCGANRMISRPSLTQRLIIKGNQSHFSSQGGSWHISNLGSGHSTKTTLQTSDPNKTRQDVSQIGFSLTCRRIPEMSIYSNKKKRQEQGTQISSHQACPQYNNNQKLSGLSKEMTTPDCSLPKPSKGNWPLTSTPSRMIRVTRLRVLSKQEMSC